MCVYALKGKDRQYKKKKKEQHVIKSRTSMHDFKLSSQREVSFDLKLSGPTKQTLPRGK